jgi:four helix bundle protein
MNSAPDGNMAKELEEFAVYQRANELSVAVTPLLDRPAFGRNRKAREQISEAVDSVLANMEEGFQQPTDRALEKYLFASKASAAEVVGRLRIAQRRGYITASELAACQKLGLEIQRMLGGWIRYLARSDWKDRGRYNVEADPKTRAGTLIEDD